jgi:hypothetical protein
MGFKQTKMSNLQDWRDLLDDALLFPFEVRSEETLYNGSVSIGKVVKVLEIVDADEHYGLLVNVRLGRRSYTLPLCDLEAIDHASPNYQPLKDYAVWFANR